MNLFELHILQNEFDIAGAVIGVELWLVGNVEELVVKQLLLQFAEPKTNAANGGCVVGYCKLQVCARGAYPSWRAGKANAFCCENRSGIALAERLKHFQLTDRFSLKAA